MNNEKINNIIKIIMNTLNEKKAQDIKTFNVANLTSLCDYIVIASTSNSTHVRSLTDDLQKVLKENHHPINHIEIDNNYCWVILDCNDFVINIFHIDARKFYNLEGLWADAPLFF